MDETDAFFTHTVVGAPFSVLLGRRQGPSTTSNEGLQVSLSDGSADLSEGWRSWTALDHLDTPAGRPRRRPKRLRRWVERHALVIALIGLMLSLGTAAFWAVMLLPATAWGALSGWEHWPWN